jgi:hypothetical protein
MRAEAIFGPVSVLALWTGGVLALTGLTRGRAIRAKRLRMRAFRLGESPEVPDDVAVVNRNYMNLLEMPVLFYVVCLSYYVTRRAGPATVGVAWAYVGLRIVHSLIHLTTNRVTHRFYVFAASNVVLVWLWVSFIRRML